MNYFQKIILIIAIVVLIISLIVIGFSIQNTKNNVWPPLIPSCPDYWTIDGSGNDTKCINVKDLGTCKPFSGDEHLIMNFNQAPYVGSNANCAKYTWANNCGLAWDGITYGVTNPCSTQNPSNSTNNYSNTYGNMYNQSLYNRFMYWTTSWFPSRRNYT
jgi:hypothetical protein